MNSPGLLAQDILKNFG